MPCEQYKEHLFKGYAGNFICDSELKVRTFVL